MEARTSFGEIAFDRQFPLPTSTFLLANIPFLTREARTTSIDENVSERTHDYYSSALTAARV
jgi:hypothetical protein